MVEPEQVAQGDAQATQDTGWVDKATKDAIVWATYPIWQDKQIERLVHVMHPLEQGIHAWAVLR